MEHGGVSKQERLEQVKDMLKNRLDLKDKPLPGYKNNVALIRSEIERLEREIAEGAEE